MTRLTYHLCLIRAIRANNENFQRACFFSLLEICVVQTFVACKLMKTKDDKCKKKRGCKKNFALFIDMQSQFFCTLNSLQKRIKIAKSMPRILLLHYILILYDTIVFCIVSFRIYIIVRNNIYRI